MAGELKDRGNDEFKKGNLAEALALYTEAISSSLADKTMLGTILTNRAACYLKLGKLQDCIDDCSASIEINHLNSKAFFRRAAAKEQLGDMQGAFKDLTELLHFDKKNNDAISALRRVKAGLEKEREKDSEVNRILTTISSGKHVVEGLRGLIGLCVDDPTHAVDFIRKGGIFQIGRFIEEELLRNKSSESTADYSNVVLGLRIFGAASTHAAFVKLGVTLDFGTNDSNFLVEVKSPPESSTLRWSGICRLIGHENGAISQASSSLALRCLKVWPAGIEVPPTSPPPVASNKSEKKSKKHYENEDDRPRVELLDDDDVDDEEEEVEEKEKEEKKPSSNKSDPPPPMKEYDLFLAQPQAEMAIRGWLQALQNPDWEAFSMTVEALSAFLSSVEDYIGQEKIIDVRMEGLADRKERIAKVKLMKLRSKKHAEWTIDNGALDILIALMDADPREVDGAVTITRRQRSTSCFGRLITAVDNDELLKNRLEKYLIGRNDPPLAPGDPLPPVEKCRVRALLEAALFLAKPELGSWALGENGGIQQVLLLASVGDERCKEVSAEVMCLASSCESGSAQLSTAVASGALQTLMRSPRPGTRAAAASAMTKLSLQAKALKEDSPETSQMLNVVLDVLKSSKHQPDTKKSNHSSNQQQDHHQLVSFSAVGDSFSSSHNKSSTTKHESSTKEERALTSTERAVEVLAAMVGKTFVKEELVHGSYRVAQSMEALLNLDLDPTTTGRSTVPYGIAHILAAVTVTNNELRAKALAEKDMSVEQYKQLQELQRVKAKDADGNEIEEKKEEDDPDTETMCRQRISRICALGGILAVVKLMSHDSKQTKEAACRTLRQMCVEESIRGLVVQQGGLKACVAIATDEDCEKSTRREAAHAIAKTLVTTNPNILSEHLRLGVMRPLIFLCREIDGTNLQQFEALLSLTNLTSCGSVEQERFIAEKGVSACHYLMFSDHFMVRRAATETLCNLGSHEALLKLLRAPDKVRLWLGLCEDWCNEENEEAYATARAAAGTLASAVGDPQVAEALLAEDCARSITSLLESGEVELIHRALVMVIDLCDGSDAEHCKKLAKHLIEGGVVPPLARVMQSDSLAESAAPLNLREMARTAGVILSKAATKGEGS